MVADSHARPLQLPASEHKLCPCPQPLRQSLSVRKTVTLGFREDGPFIGRKGGALADTYSRPLPTGDVSMGSAYTARQRFNPSIPSPWERNGVILLFASRSGPHCWRSRSGRRDLDSTHYVQASRWLQGTTFISRSTGARSASIGTGQTALVATPRRCAGSLLILHLPILVHISLIESPQHPEVIEMSN